FSVPVSMASPADEIHKDSPGMPQLKHLMMMDDEPVPTASGAEDLNPDDPESFFNEDVPLEPSALGDAVDALLLNWSQIMSNTGTKYPSVPPSLDHVKEVAAIVVQGFRDACGDLNAEFAKVALEWELENGPAAEDERVAALKGSISRQVTLLARAQAALDLRTEDYFCSSLDAASRSGAGPSSAASAAGSAPSQSTQHHHQ
ncbi:mdt-28, partial [Pristionchus pacificus]